MPAAPRRYRGLTWLGLAGFVLACSDPLPPPTACTELVLLPNSLVVEVAGSRVRAFDSEGSTRWELTLPNHDVAVTPLSAARNSMTYVRGIRAVHAITPTGSIAWSHALDPSSFPADRTFIYAPVALADSGVALVLGRKSIVSLDSSGQLRWDGEVPSGDLVGVPRGLGSGQLLVPTTTGLYAYTATGSVEWRVAP